MLRLIIYGDTELSVNNTSEWFHLVDKANPENKKLERLISYGVMLRSMVKPAFISRANDVAITGKSYNNVLYKGPTNGWTSEQQSGVDKKCLAGLIPGEVFQSNFRHGNSNGTFILSKDELKQKGIDLSNGFRFYREAFLYF